jgi:hypothetical protein
MSDEIPPQPPAFPPTPPPPPPEPDDHFPKKAGWKEFFASPVMPYPASTPAEKSWATGLHASGFAGFAFVIPFANILAPLVIWLIKRPESAYLDAVGKEVVNFQISAAIYGVVTAIIAVVLGCLIVPIVLPFIVVIGWVVYMIRALMATSEGGDFRYPATIRFIK